MDVSQVLDSVSQVVNTMWPVFSILMGIMLGLALLSFIMHTVRNYFLDDSPAVHYHYDPVIDSYTPPEAIQPLPPRPVVRRAGWTCRFCGTKDVVGSACPNCGAPRPDEYDKEQ